MSLLGLFTGDSTLLVGLEDGPDGALKAYVGHRAKGIYFLVDDEADKDALRKAWASGQHVVIPTPPADALIVEPLAAWPHQRPVERVDTGGRL